MWHVAIYSGDCLKGSEKDGRSQWRSLIGPCITCVKAPSSATDNPFSLTDICAGRPADGDRKGGRETQNLSSALPKLICDQSFLREQLSGKLFTAGLLKVSPVCVFHYINYFMWEMRRSRASLSPLRSENRVPSRNKAERVNFLLAFRLGR